MILAIRDRMGKRDGGFTLIELLVVVIIIGILAAIAIPVFLRQRERGWDAAAQSELRNAAVAQESYYTRTGTSYAGPTEAALLSDEGFRPSTDMAFAIASGNAAGYCMTASHSNSATTFRFSSEVGAPEEGIAC